MGLIINEILLSIKECEENKKNMVREAERIHEERKTYQHIKHLMGVIENDRENERGIYNA